jgi:hypothetical protein
MFGRIKDWRRIAMRRPSSRPSASLPPGIFYLKE